MKVKCRTSWQQKQGNDPDEYEDAYTPGNCDVTTSDPFYCAIADGATEASFSQEWATMLVEAFATAGTLKLDLLRARLREQIDNKQLDWFAEQKSEKGAFAAFLGLSLSPDGSWAATALGDCCLFHVRGNKLLATFPMENADCFSNSPPLLGSLTAKTDFQLRDGLWSTGDIFVLSTDAAAHFLLSTHQAKGCRWQVLTEHDDADVKALLLSLAEAKEPRLKNDDLTLMTITLSS